MGNNKTFHPLTIPALAALVFLIHGFIFYPSSGRDDIYLTLWPAYNFAKSGIISNYNGEILEQSSTFLQVILLGLFYKLVPINLHLLAHIFSVVMGVIALFLVARLTYGLGKIMQLATCLLVAINPVFTYWSFSGMEQSLTAVLAMAIVLQRSSAKNSMLWSGILALGFILVRPEAYFVLSAYVVCMLFFYGINFFYNRNLQLKTDLKQLFMFFLLTTGLFLAVCALRHYFTGYSFPLPVYAKSTGLSLHGLWFGLLYFRESWQYYSLGFLFLATTFALTILFSRNTVITLRIMHLLALILAYISFVLFSGGDWMEVYRFFSPLVPLMIVASSLLVIRHPRAGIMVMLMLASLSVRDINHISYAKSAEQVIWTIAETRLRYLQSVTNKLDNYSWSEIANLAHVRDITLVEKMDELVTKLRTAGYPKITAMAIQMGIVPYHIATRHPGVLQFQDLRGLATDDFHRCLLSASRRKTDQGLDISYDFFLDNLQAFTSQCGIDAPMIFYDLAYEMRATPLQRAGYVLYYVEERMIRTGWHNNSLGTTVFIAIRADVAARLGIDNHNFIKK